MTIARIIVLAFLVFSICCLIFVIKTKLLKPQKFKKFFIATTLIYVSGALLVFAIVFANKAMPWTFAVASESSIIVVYVFTMYMIHRMGKNMEAIMEEIEKKKLKGSSDEEDD